ncbi:hypothetical protein A6R68_22260 [Neotoma lepida]|uniref:U1-C C2H2-type zinc finger domain-containing protein n=1 Tax=Neotoma lepida TaxID=56216 RepID=A0A1A6I0E8_NEOLE|nr:hypothetical protein A6R68_22260 [Neotoma lepida]
MPGGERGALATVSEWARPLPAQPRPSVRKTHCSGRKHKENVKDYYQKWMEEQAQSLIDKTRAMIPPPPSLRNGSSSPGHDACTPHGRPSHDANDGPSSSWDDARGTWV